MKNNILSLILNVVIFVGMTAFVNAQQTKDCKSVEPNAQKACFEQLVAFNLSELIEYPADATSSGVEGKVYVRFTTNEHNDIENIRVLGKANQELADAVVKAVRKLSLEGSKEMIAKNSVYRIPINFELEK